MGNDGQGGPPHEIVLIRRRNDGDHDEPHGGVWKVAFADFMTAMMAFFLVLWIVNSTSKETRVSVARYFNPVKLSDATPSRKGVNEPSGEARRGPAETTPTANPPSQRETNAVPTKALQAPTATADVPSGAAAREHEMATKRDSHAEQQFQDPFARHEPESQSSDKAVGRPGSDRSGAPGVNRQAAALLAEISANLGDEFVGMKEAIRVVSDHEGVLISLTDQSDFGMFAVGSASPEARLLRTLRAVGEAVASRTGGIVIRGHTDSRPYKNGAVDNWQLSYQRAKAAYQGLVAAGVDDRRVERVEAYADRRLRNVDAPDAAENRRIEILLRQASE